MSLESDVWTKNPPQNSHLVSEGFLAVLVIKSDYNLNKLNYHWPLWAPSIAKPPPHTHLYERPFLPGWYPGELRKQNVTLILNETGSFWGSGWIRLSGLRSLLWPFFLWSGDLHSLSDKVRKCLGGQRGATQKGRDITHVDEATWPG